MATSQYASTPETTIANRTCRVLLGPCSDQLRDVLRHYVPPANFPNLIRRNRPNLPRLTPPQRDLILPGTGHYSGDFSDMDISLLYLLLRNICSIPPHMNGWGNSPDANDNSLAASIERLREARNKVGHSSSTSLSHTEFKDIWSYIKNSVISMDAFLNNGNKYEKEMDFLFTETMDPELEKFYREELRKQVQEDTRTVHKVMRLEESVEDQQRKVHELWSQQHESRKQIIHQQMNTQDLGVQQQESRRQIIHQQMNIQDLGVQQQQCRRHIMHQQMNIQDLGVQQQESRRQIIHQQMNIQDMGVQHQESIRQIIHQQVNIQIIDHQGHILYLRTQQQESQRQIARLTDNVQGQSTQIAHLIHGIQQQPQVIPDEEPDLNRLKERLVEINDLEIPMTPLQEGSYKLPIEQLFASVIKKEDSKETCKGKKSAQGGKEQERKEVKTPEDMLTKNGKPVRRVYMLGDAAHGKTTYCTWLLKKWCNAQTSGMSGRPLNEWENALSQFDFVF